MKIIPKYAFSLVVVLSLVLSPLATVSAQQTFTLTDMNTADRERTINQLMEQLKVIQNLLNLIKMKNALYSTAPTGQGYEESERRNLKPFSVVDGFTFGTESTINKIIVKPSDGKFSTIIMYSDDKERVHLSMTPIDNPSDVFISDEIEYVINGEYYKDDLLEGTRTVAPVTYKELKNELFGNAVSAPRRTQADYDAWERNLQFLINNPVYYGFWKVYEGDENLLSTINEDCYDKADTKSFREVLKGLLDGEKFKYNDLDKIVTFISPVKDMGYGPTSKNKCFEKFDPDLDNA